MNPWRRSAIWLTLLAAAARGIYAGWGPLGLAPDEAYYWVWSQHPDLS